MREKELNNLKKEYLRSYRPIENRIRQIDDDIRALRMEADSSRAAHYSYIPSASSEHSNIQESYVIALEEAVSKRLEMKAEYVRKRDEIKNCIHEIGDADLERLLEYRYIDKLSWYEVEKKMNYGKSQVNRMHSKALRKLNYAE